MERERENLDLLRGSSSTSQDFSMANNHQFATRNLDADYWPAGNHRHPDFWAASNHLRQDADFLGAAANPPISPYHAPNLLFDTSIESEFSRLGLAPAIRPPNTYMTPPPPAYDATPHLPYDAAAAQQPHISLRDIQRMRIQLAAARGQYEDFDVSGYDYIGNLYNSGGRYLNEAGLDYQPQGFLNGYFSSPLNSNRIQPNSSMCGGRPRQRPNLSSLKDLRGKMVSLAKDQHGCRFLQNKFEEGKAEEIQMIFVEVKDHVCELVVHQFGNYLIQKFFEVCSQEQMNQLVMILTDDDLKFTAICTDMYGTRAVQKLIEHLTTSEQMSRIISVFRRITVALTKSMNGHHVIQHCLKFFSIENKKHILNVVADNCLDIATDKSGCCVLQQCVEHALGEPRNRLITEITSNALILSEHPYGNYVVQYIIGLKIEQTTKDIMTQLRGNFVSLSMNKYGSNVVEKCLKESEESEILSIIEELINSPNMLRVLQDPYGNYVAQSALAKSKGAIRHAMISMILVNYPNLHSHPHGKRVLARIKGSKMYV